VQKHGISFEEAVSVFADAMALTFSDSDHSESEDRSRTYGMSNKGRLLEESKGSASQLFCDR